MYNFDEIIDRSGTSSTSEDGFRSLFGDKAGEKLPFEDKDLIRMWVADMGFSTPDFVIDAVKARLDRKIMGYTEIMDDSYYNCVAIWCKRRYGLEFKQEELCISAGVVAALKSIVGILKDESKNVLILTPSYAPFKGAADYNGLGCVYSRLTDTDGHFTIDFEDFEKKAEDKDTNICIFCNPHNPTGRVWTEEELTKVGYICRKNNMWLISDEIHCDLLRNGFTHISFGNILPDYDKLVICMAPSKTFNMAGFMMSNIIIRNENLRKEWYKKNSNMVSPLSLAAATAAFSKGDSWLEELKTYLDGNFKAVKDIFDSEIPKSNFKISEATYLAWLDISAYLKNDKDINVPYLFAKEGGVVIEYGNMFVDNGTGHIRINLACPLSMAKEGAKRICTVLKKLETGEIKL